MAAVCKTAHQADEYMSRVHLIPSHPIPRVAKEEGAMAVRRDFSNERISRVEAQLAAARAQVSLLGPTDRRRAAQLRDQLDDMLVELLGPTEAGRRRDA
jgi:hypothetical protein